MENRRIINVGEDSLEYERAWESMYGRIENYLKKNLCNACEQRWDDNSLARYIIFNKGTILWWHGWHGVESFQNVKK